jgi:hypothetical protein
MKIMELDELKNAWTSLDERLGKQEVLKEFVIKEMIYSKSNKSVSKLLNFDLFSIMVLLLVIPVLIFIYQSRLQIPEKSLFLYSMLVIGVYGLIGGAFHLNCLMRINFTKGVAYNSLYINKYKKMVQKEKIITVPVILVVSFFCIYQYAVLHASAWLWAFLICGLVSGIIFTYFSFKRIYDNNIHAIQSSLEELKELKEE